MPASREPRKALPPLARSPFSRSPLARSPFSRCPLALVPLALVPLALVACGTPSHHEARADKPLKATPPTLVANGMRTCRVVEGRGVCWGSNAQGGWRPDAPPALRVPLVGPFEGPIRQIAPLEASTCVLREDGTVQCLGVHPRSIQETTGLTAIRSLAAGPGFACAVHLDGAVSCWGVGAPGSAHRHERFAIEGLDDAVALAVERTFACALKRDHTVACWGDNRFGQLGDGSDRAHDTPAPIAHRAQDVVQVAVGAGHACLLTTSGAVYCWGHDDEGQVDGGDRPTVLEPTPVPDVAGARAIAAGGNTSCAIDARGVVCWGSGVCGQRGITPEHACFTRHAAPGDREPRLVAEGQFDELAMGQLHVCARRGATVTCWGADDVGQLGRGAGEGLTYGGTCHPRAARCASETPTDVSATVEDPAREPLGEGIPWAPSSTFADAPRPPPHDVTLEVLDPVGHDAAWLQTMLRVTMTQPVLSCYRRLGEAPPERTMEVRIEENGREIPRVTTEQELDNLTRCVRATFARGYYSVEGTGSFGVRLTFRPEGWDGRM
ncbi:MAG: RCC1 domain-containing protein [Sandaracinaceae bacterium]